MPRRDRSSEEVGVEHHKMMTVPTGARLRAAFVCDGDITSVDTWSGTPFHILHALERHFDVALAVRRPWPRGYHAIGRALKIATGRRFDHSRSSLFNRIAAVPVAASIRRSRPDVVFAVSATGLAESLIDEFAVVSCADATPRGLFELSRDFLTVPPVVRRAADRIDRKVIERALLCVYSSNWARASAIADYDADPDRVLAIPFGANTDIAPRPPRQLPTGALRLLFVGKDWNRKGGRIAVAMVEQLRARGHAVQLDIAGVGPDVVGPVPDGVTIHGMLRKDRPDEAALLDQLYAEASFFVMPTQAECYGIVFAEAAHAALPSIAYANGGVPTVVLDGRTGLLLPPGASPAAFADIVEQLIADPARYAAMSQAALADAHARLNWTAWADAVAAAVRQRLPR
jgi:glycosyltransferase involved in cell wall biosynthesis